MFSILNFSIRVTDDLDIYLYSLWREPNFTLFCFVIFHALFDVFLFHIVFRLLFAQNFVQGGPSQQGRFRTTKCHVKRTTERGQPNYDDGDCADARSAGGGWAISKNRVREGQEGTSGRSKKPLGLPTPGINTKYSTKIIFEGKVRRQYSTISFYFDRSTINFHSIDMGKLRPR